MTDPDPNAGSRPAPFEPVAQSTETQTIERLDPPERLRAPSNGPDNLGEAEVAETEARVDEIEENLRQVQQTRDDLQPPIEGGLLRLILLGGVGAVALTVAGWPWLAAGAAAFPPLTLGVAIAALAGTGYGAYVLARDGRQYLRKTRRLDHAEQRLEDRLAEANTELNAAQDRLDENLRSVAQQVSPAGVTAIGSAAQIMSYGPPGGEWSPGLAAAIRFAQPVVLMPSEQNPTRNEIVTWPDPPGAMVELRAGSEWTRAGGYCREEASDIRRAVRRVEENVRARSGQSPEAWIVVSGDDRQGTTGARNLRYNLGKLAPEQVAKLFLLHLSSGEQALGDPIFGEETVEEATTAPDPEPVDSDFAWLDGTLNLPGQSEDESVPSAAEIASPQPGEIEESRAAALIQTFRGFPDAIHVLAHVSEDYDAVDPELRLWLDTVSSASALPVGQAGGKEMRAVDLGDPPHLMDATPVQTARSVGEFKASLREGLETFTGSRIQAGGLEDREGRLPTRVWTIGTAPPEMARRIPSAVQEVLGLPSDATPCTVAPVPQDEEAHLTLLMPARDSSIETMWPGSTDHLAAALTPATESAADQPDETGLQTFLTEETT